MWKERCDRGEGVCSLLDIHAAKYEEKDDALDKDYLPNTKDKRRKKVENLLSKKEQKTGGGSPIASKKWFTKSVQRETLK